MGNNTAISQALAGTRFDPFQDFERILAGFPMPELTGKRLFITGGTGFFGYWLLSALSWLNEQQQEIEVVVLSRKPEQFLARHPQFRSFRWLSFIQGEVNTYIFPDGSFDAIIHGAADTSPQAASRPLTLFDSIVSGAHHVLDHAVNARTQRVLLISSGAVYGKQPANMERIPENADLGCDSSTPANAYGEGKRAMEMLGTCYGREYGLLPIFARAFAFVGPYLPEHLAISQFIRDALFRDKIVVTGDGKPCRSYLYAADLAVWLLALLVRGQPSQAYNLGSDDGISLLDTAYRVRNIIAPGKKVEVLSKGDIGPRHRYVPDITLARRDAGLGMWTDFETAIRRTASWHLQQK